MDKEDLIMEKLQQEEEETLMNEEEEEEEVEMTSEEALELDEKELNRKLTKAELRFKKRVEAFFDKHEGRDVVDVVGELFVKLEDLEKKLDEFIKVEKDEWKRQGIEL